MINRRTALLALSVGSAAVWAAACRNQPLDNSAQPDVRPSEPAGAAPSVIGEWEPRFGRSRPLIGVLAANSGTELADFVVPFGVLSAAGVAEVVTVGLESGPVAMGPGVRAHADMTVEEFDNRYPDGADYVVVPALRPPDSDAAVRWIRQQAAKGGSTVSICDGALTVATAGLMNGKQATGHWASHERRRVEFPDVRWRDNARYVADGRIVSSAGISASMPVSIALIAAFAGRSRADEVAKNLGLRDWGPTQNSQVFRNGPPLQPNQRSETLDAIGVEIGPGTDEVAFALVADAYSYTGRTRAFAVSTSLAPVRTRHGLTILPARVTDEPGLADVVTVPAGTPPVQALDSALTAIEHSYGRSAAITAARVMEYPGYSP